MLKFLELDHIAINVKDKMDQAYILFSEIGFQLSPRGYHSLGSLKLQLKSLDFLRKMNTKKIKNLSKIEIGDKVQLLLKDYNLILEFEEL